MQNNLDINYVVESLTEKVNQLTTETIIKDATIKQLVAQINSMSEQSLKTNQPTKKDK